MFLPAYRAFNAFRAAVLPWRGVLTEALHMLTFRRCKRRKIGREDRSGTRVPERTPEKVGRRRSQATGTHKSSQGTKEVRMVTETTAEHRGGSAERDGAGVSTGRPARLHHVVARDGDKGLEVLRIPLEGKG